MLRERPHGAAAEVRSRPVATVADKRRAHDLEPAAAREDGAAPATVVRLPGGVAGGERQVLHDETRRGLVITMRRGPGLPPVAGVLIQDTALPATAEGDQTAAVEDDAAARVDHLGGLSHLDPHRVRAAAEPDHPTLCHRPHDRARCAAPRRAGPDPTVRARRVDRPRLSRHRRRHRGERYGKRAGKGQARRREYGLSIHGHLRLGTLAGAGFEPATSRVYWKALHSQSFLLERPA